MAASVLPVLFFLIDLTHVKKCSGRPECINGIRGAAKQPRVDGASGVTRIGQGDPADVSSLHDRFSELVFWLQSMKTLPAPILYHPGHSQGGMIAPALGHASPDRNGTYTWMPF